MLTVSVNMQILLSCHLRKEATSTHPLMGFCYIFKGLFNRSREAQPSLLAQCLGAGTLSTFALPF